MVASAQSYKIFSKMPQFSHKKFQKRNGFADLWVKEREDITYYGNNGKNQMIRIGKWDVTKGMPDVNTMIPRG